LFFIAVALIHPHACAPLRHKPQRHTSNLDAAPPSIVDTLQQRFEALRAEVIIDCRTNSAEMAIVIHYQHSASGEARIQFVKLMRRTDDASTQENTTFGEVSLNSGIRNILDRLGDIVKTLNAKAGIRLETREHLPKYVLLHVRIAGPIHVMHCGQRRERVIDRGAQRYGLPNS
jgi:hypothetical protein